MTAPKTIWERIGRRPPPGLPPGCYDWTDAILSRRGAPPPLRASAFAGTDVRRAADDRLLDILDEPEVQPDWPPDTDDRPYQTGGPPPTNAAAIRAQRSLRWAAWRELGRRGWALGPPYRQP